MAEEQTNPIVPKVTPGEAVTWGTMLLSTLPHQEWGLGFFYLLVAGGTWALRRQPEFRGFIEEKVEQMEEHASPRLLTGFVRRIPVPPAGVRGLLEGPRGASRGRTARGVDAAGVEPEVLEGVRMPQRGEVSIRKGLIDLFGEDNPLEQQKPAAKVSSRSGGATRANLKVVKTASPKDRAAQWVASTVEGDVPPLKVLSLQDVVEAINKDIDDHPHILIVGNSGAGKTVLAQLIVGTRPGKLVVLDPKRPKGWEGAKWGGLPYVSRDPDGSYRSMVAALSQVVAEMNDRYQRQETASEPFQQLTVVLDEAKNSLEECPELADQYRLIVSIGREVGVRLVLISTTDRARKLGFDGEADSLDSFTWVRLGDFAVRVLPEVAERGEERYYHAVVDRAGKWVSFENELAFGLVKEHLKLRATKAWNEVTYNCQVAAVKKPVVVAHEDDEPPARRPPRRPTTPTTVVSAAREVVDAPQPAPAPEPEFDLLAGLLTGGSVNTFQREVPLEVKAEVYRAAAALPKSQIGTSKRQEDAEATSTSATSALADPRESAKLSLRELTRKWSEVAEVDRRLALNALQFVRQGRSVTAAVEAVWGSSGGRKFPERAALVKMAVEMADLARQLNSR